MVHGRCSSWDAEAKDAVDANLIVSTDERWGPGAKPGEDEDLELEEGPAVSGTATMLLKDEMILTDSRPSESRKLDGGGGACVERRIALTD